MFADVKLALRQLAKAPGFAAAAIVTIALGIGTATTVFTVFSAILVRPLPFIPRENELVKVVAYNRLSPAENFQFSLPDFYEVRARARSFVGGLVTENRTCVILDQGRPQRIWGTWITVDGFATLGVRPALGRTFRPEEDNTNRPDVVVIGHELWQSRFGGRKDIVGSKVAINGLPATVIGIMPPGFRFPESNELWQPMPRGYQAEEKTRGDHNYPFYARLRPGATLESAQRELDAIARQIAAEHPLTNAKLGFRALRARDEATLDERSPLRLMLAAVLAILLIACANVANLLLVRGAGRTREMAMRVVLGAGRGRLVRQLLTESLVLGLIGAAAGILLASWELSFVLWLIPIEMPYWIRFDLDWRVMAFVASAAVGTSLLFGLMPAVHLSDPRLADQLKEGGRSGTGTGRVQRLRALLVVAQVALALMLLVVAGLSLRSFWELQVRPLGIDPRQVLTFRFGIPPVVEAPGGPHAVDAQLALFFARARQELARIPGVESAALTSTLPAQSAQSDFSYQSAAVIEGAPEPASIQDAPSAYVRFATPEIFATLRIPLLAGRTFDTHDGPGQPLVAVVDSAFAQRFFPGGKAIGKRFTNDPPGPNRKWLTVVGIVGDVAQVPRAPGPQPSWWVPIAQHTDNFVFAALRVNGNPESYLAAAQNALLRVRPDVPLYFAHSMEEIVSISTWKERFFGSLFAAFAAIAVVLSALGIYAVMAYAVEQRSREIGVRMALGAAPAAILGMVFRQGMGLVATGLALGFVASWFSTRLMTALLYGVSPHDPPTFLAVPLMLGAAALLACYLPSRRAVRADPMTALRAE